MGEEKKWIDKFYREGNDFYRKTYENGQYYDLDGAYEAKQIAKLLQAEQGSHILDWCGAWGRHAIPLAKNGHRRLT